MSKAVEHGTQAVGAARLRPGACWTPEDDLLYALGFPHLFLVSDDEPDDPEASARHFMRHEAVVRTVSAAVLPRLIRAHAIGRSKRREAERDAVLASDSPIEPDEAESLFREYLRLPFSGYFGFQGPYLFEAVLGPVRVVELFLQAMEDDPSHWFEQRGIITCLVFELGYFLMRMPESVAEGLRTRAEALLDAHADAIGLHRSGANFFPFRQLDLVLNGRLGAERSGRRVDGFVIPGELRLVHDDPDFVFEQAMGLPTDASSRPEARIAFLVGERWLEEEARRWRRYRQPTPGSAHAVVVDQLGRFRSDTVLAMMLDMASGSKAKRAVTTWFVDHAEHARPFLEAAVGGERDLTARKLLKKVR